MLIRVNGTEIVGHTTISRNEHEAAFLANNPDFISIDHFDFLEDLDLYEYVDNKIQLKSDWVTIKAERQAVKDAELLERYRENKLKELKASFLQKQENARVDTGLGFPVDGTYLARDNFYAKWESMEPFDTTTVRDADNNFQENVTKEQMQVLYRTIVQNGEALYHWKWNKELDIANAGSIEALNLIDLS